MKILSTLLLLYTFTLQAQVTDSIKKQSIAVVSVEKMNVVYRGIDNPIKIAVPGAVSFNANAPGLKKVDDNGNYLISAGSGLEVKVAIEAVMQDGSILHEEKIFRIKGLPAPTGTIDDLYSNGQPILMSKEKLIKSVIGIELLNFLWDVNFNVTHFILSIPAKKIDVYVEGNIMNGEAIKIIQNLKPKTLVLLNSIKFGDPTVHNKRVSDIFIEIN